MAAPNSPSAQTVRVVNPKVFERTVNGAKETYASYYDPSTGDYWVSKEPPTSPKSKDESILLNGSWTEKGVQISEYFEDGDPNKPKELAKTTLTQVKESVKQAYTNIGGANNAKVNPSVNSDQFNAQGSSDKNLIIEGLKTLVGLEDLINLFENVKLPDITDFGTDMKSLFKTPLYYPLDLKDSKQDVLVITQFEYKSPYNELFKGELNKASLFSAGTIQNGAQRMSALRNIIQTVTLPIPNNVSDSNAAGWGEDKMNTIAMAAAGNIPAAAIATAISTASEFASKFAGGLPGVQGQAVRWISDAIAKNPGLIYGLMETEAMNNPGLGAAIQSMILNKIGFTDVNPEQILSRGYGVITNANVELLFTGPSLRGFQFGYVMSPRSKEEADMCRKILRFFKQGMAPKKNRASSTGYGGPSFFLATPNVFKLEYKSYDASGKPIKIKGLNRFKICALTNLQTSYSDGQWAAYEEGQPARMQMNLVFKELEPVYENDYQETKSKALPTKPNGYNDLDSVKPDEIGY